jgi:putative salt-induced outer membrane protein YdiY
MDSTSYYQTHQIEAPFQIKSPNTLAEGLKSNTRKVFPQGRVSSYLNSIISSRVRTANKPLPIIQQVLKQIL